MNIGLFTDTYFPQINGVGTSVHTLADALEKRGHHVYIFTPSDPRADTHENSRIIRMPSMPFLLLKNFRFGMVYSPHVMNKIINHLHLDIVHTQTEFPLGMFGKFLSTAYRIPMVHTYHTMYEDYVHYIAHGILVTPSMAKEFSKLFCNSAKAVIAPTEKAKTSLTEYGVKKPIYIIPTGIDTAIFDQSKFSKEEILNLRKSFGLASDTPVILYLGRIAKEKSIDVILKAMPALLDRLPNAKLLLVGDGPEREILERITSDLNIKESVIFAGARPWTEIGIYYQLGTVFVSASVSETQGLTFAEAMAGGIPVVAKKDQSIEALVEDNKTGLLFEQDEDLSQKLYELLSDKELRQRLSESSLEKMKDLSVEKFADSVEALYQKILSQNPRTPRFSPVSISVRAVKRIGKIPKKIVKRRVIFSSIPSSSFTSHHKKLFEKLTFFSILSIHEEPEQNKEEKTDTHQNESREEQQ